METFQKIPYVRLYNDQIIVYEQFDTRPPRSDKQKKNEDNLTRGDYNGFMSPKTRSKVKKYLSTWVDAVKSIEANQSNRTLDKVPRLTFVTLTLPSTQIHEDNLIKRKCLTPFIQTLQRKYGVWHYFWRAEAQANGSIHFHLIVDSYIPWRDLRDEWNTCIDKLGYVGRYQERHSGMSFETYMMYYPLTLSGKDTIESKQKAYANGVRTGWRDPNSTDIHDLKRKNSPASYVIKYCTKSDGYRKITGRIHGCSDGLKTLHPYEDLVHKEIGDFVLDVMNDPKSYTIKDPDFTVIKCSLKEMVQKYYPALQKRLNAFRTQQVLDLYTIQIPEEITEPPPDFEKKIPKYKQLHFEF